MGKSKADGSKKAGAAPAANGPVTVLMVCGLPGSGKSTFSGKLAQSGWERVNQDEMGTAGACQKALEKALKHRKSVIVDRCCVTPSDRKMWVRIARAAECNDKATGKPLKINVECVFLDVSPAECKRRIQSRKNHPTLGPDAVGVVDEFCRGFKQPEKWEGPYDACFVAGADTVDRLLPRYADPRGVAMDVVPNLAAVAVPATSSSSSSSTTPPSGVANGGKMKQSAPAAGCRGANLSTKGCGVYLVRHGERTDRVEGAVVTNPDDCELTKEGRKQSRCAGEFINNHCASAGQPLQAIYSSPFFRCVQTAVEAAGQLGVKLIRIEPGLAELCSDRIFKRGAPVLTPSREVLQYVADKNMTLDASVAPVAAGLPAFPESGSAANGRIRRTVSALAQRHAGERIALFMHSHGLVDATQSLPVNARTLRVNPRPGYCGLTYIADCGTAQIATDLVYRATVSGCIYNPVVDELAPPPPAPAGSWGRTWVWVPATAAAAVTSSSSSSSAVNADGGRGAGAGADDYLMASLAVGEESEDARPQATSSTEGRRPAQEQEHHSLAVAVSAIDDPDAKVDRILAAELADVFAAFPKFEVFFKKGGAEQQVKFTADWANDGPVKHLKIRQKVAHGVKLGWFALGATGSPGVSPPASPGLTALVATSPPPAPTDSGNTLRIATWNAEVLPTLPPAHAVAALDALTATAAASDIICIHNATTTLYTASLAPDVLFHGAHAGVAGVYASSAAAIGAGTRSDGRFGVIYSRKTLCPSFQVSMIAVGPARGVGGNDDTAVFATVYPGDGQALVVGAVATDTTADGTLALTRTVDIAAALRKGEGGDGGAAVLAVAAAADAGHPAAPLGYTHLGVDSATAAAAAGAVLFVSASGDVDGPPRRHQDPTPQAGPQPATACLHLRRNGTGTSGARRLAAVPSKFPRTQHAYAVGGVGFDDLVLPEAFVRETFHNTRVTVEEKVDGSNLGIYFDESGEIVCQNRGKVVSSASGSQWGRLSDFIDHHRDELYALLGGDYILYGEWMVARHSIHYTRLPSHFIAFDLYHRPSRKFLSVAQRDARLAGCSFAVVKPLTTTTRFANKDEILALLRTQSHYTNATVEGVYLRADTADGMWLAHRAKIVNAEFIQGIDEHWQKRTMEKNVVVY